MNSFCQGLGTHSMIPPSYLHLSHTWCYFHFNPSGEFPEDWERENANLGVHSTSSSFIIHRKWICANGQISTQPGQGPTLCSNSVFSWVAFSWQSPGEEMHWSKFQTSQHLLRARERLQEKTTRKQGCNYLKLKAVTMINLVSRAHHSLGTSWKAPVIHYHSHVPSERQNFSKENVTVLNFKILFSDTFNS